MSIGFGGAWFSNFGRLEIVEEAGAARGSYTHKGGRVEGTVEGAVLRGRWSEGARGGPVTLTLAPGGNAFRGQWSYEGDPGHGGEWTGARLHLPSAAEGGFPGAVNALAEGPLLAGPMIGEVGERDAFIWAQARDTAPLTLVMRDAGGRETRQTVHPAWDEWLCVVFHLEGLTPGVDHELRVESAPHGSTSSRRLRPAPAPDARRARVAFGSCFRDFDDPSLTIFESIRAERPDLFLMIGDNCYYDEPDWQTQHTMMAAQLRNRGSAALQPLLAEVPVLGIWDDHDYGANDADGTSPEKDDALPVFRRAFAQRAYGLPETPGIFSTVRFGPVELFLTDGRWYRQERRHILGAAQLAWLFRKLEESTAPVKLLVSGSQVLPHAAAGLDWECWHKDAPGELAALQAFLEERDIRGVVLATGDVHLGYLLHARGRPLPGGRRGPELWELTASPLANEPWYETVMGKDLYDPTILAEHPVCNYGLVDVDLDREGAEVELHLCDPSGRRLASQPIPLASLRVREERPRLSAVLRSRDQATFFTQGRAHLWSTRAQAPVPGQSRPVAQSFPGLPAGGFDAAVAWPNGRAYFFRGNGYHAVDLATGQALPGYPRYIARYWPGVWPGGVDAAVVWPTGKAYLFHGDEYLRYDVAADRTDEGYPRKIADGWPGLWQEGIDAAVLWDDQRAYFFKGAEVMAWDVAGDRVEEGYPRALEELWPGVLGERGVG